MRLLLSPASIQEIQADQDRRPAAGDQLQPDGRLRQPEACRHSRATTSISVAPGVFQEQGFGEAVQATPAGSRR